jgi:hypothetical protein
MNEVFNDWSLTVDPLGTLNVPEGYGGVDPALVEVKSPSDKPFPGKVAPNCPAT